MPSILRDTDAIIRVDATTVGGTRAGYVRVPVADTSTYPIPPGITDEQILMLADILPTGYEVGVLNGAIRAPGLSSNLVRRQSSNAALSTCS